MVHTWLCALKVSKAGWCLRPNVSHQQLTSSSLAVENEGQLTCRLLQVCYLDAHSSLSRVIAVGELACLGWALEGGDAGNRKINFCC